MFQAIRMLHARTLQECPKALIADRRVFSFLKHDNIGFVLSKYLFDGEILSGPPQAFTFQDMIFMVRLLVPLSLHYRPSDSVYLLWFAILIAMCFPLLLPS